jgi:short-subunit dehydrogenase
MKNILITGASSGLGAALAVQYAGPHTRLFLGGRDMARLMETEKACVAKGSEVHLQMADVTAHALMHQWIVGVDKRYPLDLVIANAGISGGTSGLTPEKFAEQSARIFETNVTGVLHTIHPILPRMVSRRQGQIAMISSMASFSGWPGAPAYSASKAAVRYYGEALRGRLKHDKIRINVICPGFIETGMTAVNPFPMPFIMSSEKAARIIQKGLDKDRGLIVFPRSISLCVRLLSLLPFPLRNAILSRSPEKTALQNF